ncbi:OLC1v1004920C1 [Oldenlandia corymbosa var. corymbosa]|uniref:OLC1v1004920C1 n=1 Tax=Oldenlandia corymbosa var. corymbosa TaxID=529605 RepID=A0AAV1DDG6_OLDCO|nr:OLC1v1004920C1 [Oldenlandia corymbosa var. corymbosa]
MGEKSSVTAVSKVRQVAATVTEVAPVEANQSLTIAVVAQPDRHRLLSHPQPTRVENCPRILLSLRAKHSPRIKKSDADAAAAAVPAATAAGDVSITGESSLTVASPAEPSLTTSQTLTENQKADADAAVAAVAVAAEVSVKIYPPPAKVTMVKV